MQIFETVNNYEREVVIPALGDDAGDYDTLAIAQDMVEWTAEHDDEGRSMQTHSGFVEREDVDFWEVAAQHCTDEKTQLSAIVSLDEEITDLEERLGEMKTQRDQMARAAVANGATVYAVAKACGRTPSTVHRWVK
mgnify:FL=1